MNANAMTAELVKPAVPLCPLHQEPMIHVRDAAAERHWHCAKCTCEIWEPMGKGVEGGEA